ncbi:YciI family protein [Kribbella aluminosa]|uniref:YciI family protein n=1 Tax=Kribbella aluminosa TaxID=416017 RepID=UPI00338B705C
MRVKYVLMFVETEEFAKDFAALEPAEKEAAYRRVYQWFEDHADKITNRGSKLQGAETATTVRLDGSVMTTDGPFIEGKEVVSGFTEIDVEDLDEALRMVKTWPACPVIEIRPVAEM